MTFGSLCSHSAADSDNGDGGLLRDHSLFMVQLGAAFPVLGAHFAHLYTSNAPLPLRVGTKKQDVRCLAVVRISSLDQTGFDTKAAWVGQGSRPYCSRSLHKFHTDIELLQFKKRRQITENQQRNECRRNSIVFMLRSYIR